MIDALWARVEGLEQGEVRRVLEEERGLVKTWTVRGTLHLLPPEVREAGLDPYVMGSKPRDAFVSSDLISRVFRQQGWVSPVVLVDGRVAGLWSHERRGGSVRVDVEPFETLPGRARKELADEVERLAAFLGGTPELAVAA